MALSFFSFVFSIMPNEPMMTECLQASTSLSVWWISALLQPKGKNENIISLVERVRRFRADHIRRGRFGRPLRLNKSSRKTQIIRKEEKRVELLHLFFFYPFLCVCFLSRFLLLDPRSKTRRTVPRKECVEGKCKYIFFPIFFLLFVLSILNAKIFGERRNAALSVPMNFIVFLVTQSSFVRERGTNNNFVQTTSSLMDHSFAVGQWLFILESFFSFLPIFFFFFLHANWPAPPAEQRLRR